MFDELSDLRLFTQIVAAGSLSEAARRVNASLTSISRRLASFEDRMGVRLIDRGSRKFCLTDEGRVLYERALPIIAAVDAAAAELDTLSGEAQGLLRVSAPNEIGRKRISVLCREFAKRFPKVSIQLVLSDTRPDILEDELDVAIQTKRPTQGDVIHRKLLSSRRVICASPDYIDAHGRPETPDDLKAHNCIRMLRGREIYDQWTLKMGDGGVQQIGVTGALVTNDGETIHDWVLGGVGVAVKALWDIQDDLRNGRLIELLDQHSCDKMDLYATHFDRRHVPPRIRLFIDFLAERLPRAIGSLASPGDRTA